MTKKVKGMSLIPDGTESDLNQRQLEDYRSHRRKFLIWCLTQGKQPETNTGYSEGTMKVRHYRVNSFYRWVWENRGYTTTVTHDDADEFLRELAISDYEASTKAHFHKSLMTLFKWRKYEYGDSEWEPVLSFTASGGSSSSRDFLTKEERVKIREASLEYGSIPDYNSCSPSERDRYKGHLARQFDVPKEDVGLDHWERFSTLDGTYCVICDRRIARKPRAKREGLLHGEFHHLIKRRYFPSPYEISQGKYSEQERGSKYHLSNGLLVCKPCHGRIENYANGRPHIMSWLCRNITGQEIPVVLPSNS